MEHSIKTSVNDVNEKHFAPIKKVCNDILHRRTIIKDGKKINANIGTMHLLLQQYCKTIVELKVCEIIADSIVFCEKKIPTSGLILISKINNSFKQSSQPAKRISFSNAKETALSITANSASIDLFEEIITLASADSRISVIRQPINKPIIKLKARPEVRLEIPERFKGIDFLLPQEISDVYFFMINGSIAKLSELEFFFNSTLKTNSYYVLVTKSFSDETIDVLKVNFINRKLKIIPAMASFDLDSINSLADLGSVVGGQPISSDLGDLISGDHSARFGYSEKVILKHHSFEFFGKNLGNVEAQIQSIRKRVQDTSSQDKQELLTRRLSNLTANSCEVILPRGAAYDSIARDLGVSFSILKTCSAYLCKEASIFEGSKSIYFPDASLQIADDRFIEICKIFENTNRAVIKADVD